MNCTKPTQCIYSGREASLTRLAENTALPRYQREWHKILCFLPVYLPGDQNGCRIYYEDGSMEEISRSLAWVLDDWARLHRTSVSALQQQSARWLGQKRGRRLPLVVDYDLCLIPIKYRAAKKRNDAVSGYVMLHKIQHVYVQTDGKTLLSFFNSPLTIHVLEQYNTLRDNLHTGWQLMRYFEQIRCGTQ